jgi:hypothetical protein
MNSVMLTVTEGDPRLDSCGKVMFEGSGMSMGSARIRAKAWARIGYWASIYALSGECIDEFKPEEVEEQ